MKAIRWPRPASGCLLLAGVALVAAGASPVAAKGGWSWEIVDRDGFLIAGQRVTARALMPVHKALPRQAWLLEGWEWNDQDAKVPRDRVLLGDLEPTRYELYGDEMVGFEINFHAPRRPGEYTIVTCIDPCRDIAPNPYPRTIAVAENRLEVRLSKQLLKRDARISDLEGDLRRARNRSRAIEERLSDHLGYLSSHVTRISDLEELVTRRRVDPRQASAPWALPGLAGAVAGFLAARVRRRGGRASQ